MYSNKLKKNIKTKIINWIRKEANTWEVLLAEDILVSTDTVIDKTPFNKTFITEMFKEPTAIAEWYLSKRIRKWLASWNVLNYSYIEQLRTLISSKTVVSITKNLIDCNIIKRRKRWVYVLNPRYAIYGSWVKKEVYDFFEEKTK